MELKEEKGITLVALMLTVVVMMIIASIAIYSGRDIIKRANLESLKTNMLLIEAKARGYVEEVNHKAGIKPSSEGEALTTWTNNRETIKQEIYETNGKLTKASEAGITIPSGIDASNCYYVTQEALEIMGLKKIEIESDEAYLVKFDEENVTVEVYNTLGYNDVYSLTEIEEIEE